MSRRETWFMGNHNVLHRPIDESLKHKPRVFISHRAADKQFARAIASYFENLGLHYYFDGQDEVLQAATRAGHTPDSAIVEAIEQGLAHCTHLLAVLSRRTMGSWWVPFEIGTARASGKDVRHFLLPSIAPSMVPEYLRIYPQLWRAHELFEWVSELTLWRQHLVHQQYAEYLSDVFGELGPDEEEVEHWHYTADRWNKEWLDELEAVFQFDVTSD